MRGVVYTLFMLALGMGSLAAQNVSGARVLFYGYFDEVRNGQVDAPETASGYVNSTSSEMPGEETDAIVAKIGTAFGVDYVIEGTPEGAEIELRIRLRHPPLRNPATGKTVTVSEHTASSILGQRNHDGFGFENAWEVVPGTWTFEVHQGEKLLLKKAFEVTVP